MRTFHKDFLGRAVTVGDKVVATYGNYQSLYHHTVIKITEKRIGIDNGGEIRYISPNQVIKLESL